ncbi:MAG: FAD-dependent oxidoreductase [Dehalococcoidia bacterium]|nr:FAD-dependent oxidoreductase [Dehalococcoidia bacterium]RLC65131.1 MAG: pyridine nucleotide-disulfide oxidoreductase [Chloroflexota bacterium]
MSNRENGQKSVLVIGGGIAGIQASLDLANMGFKVYLVEKLPSIGGRMAQLDKTFPTNDCAMCILAPKMIEASTHNNIELLTYCEVEKVSGEAGKFEVKVKKKSSFVDWDKCTGCGLCIEGCPVILPNEFDQGIGKRKAIYMLFPQAVPKKCVIDKREDRPCKAACMDACPVHTNVPGYIKLVAEGEFKEAYKLIRETTPLPACVGRVCYAPCQDVCNRGEIDEPLCIRDIKRVPSDQWSIEELEVPPITKTDKKVAVIGSGPAGLAAANDLALKGHSVTIFEALPEPGGMLRVGIPEYRLPKEILRQEIGYIQKLGVEVKTGIRVGKDITLEKLKKDYDAVFIAIGTHGGMKLGVEGEDIPGVMEGIGFLRAVNLGEKIDVGNRVAVIGGGNTAIDCARTAKRLGAKEVTIVYRRSRAEMPASAEEVTAAEEEDIKIEFLTIPSRFSSENKKLAKMECVRMKLGEPDASGRPRPIPIEGSEFIISVDTVITALGQTPEADFVKQSGVSLSKKGTIEIDAKTGVTSVEGVFAGGDVVTGPAFVIDAIAAGKKAARSMDQYLNGQPLEPEEEWKEPEKLSQKEIEDLKKRFPSRNRVGMRREPAKKRIQDFREVALGYSLEEALEEASRCLAGQTEGCIECHECERRCEPKAIVYTKKDESIELKVGAIIVASGLGLYDISALPEYGYGKIKNVISAMEFERLTAASGPTMGELRRPSDGKIPENIAFIQCVGSRDFRHKAYCSSVCCMHSTKEAMLAFEHHPGTRSFIFYMDMRAVGKRFQEYIARAKQEYNVTYIRSRPGRIEVNPDNDNPIIWYEETSSGEVKKFEVELVVLAQAMIPQITRELAEILEIELDEDGFVRTADRFLQPLDTTKPGIFTCGYVHSPRDIPDSVTQASGAAGRVAEEIASSRLNRDSQGGN